MVSENKRCIIVSLSADACTYSNTVLVSSHCPFYSIAGVFLNLQRSFVHALYRLHNLDCMEDGLDEDIEWPAMPATAVLLIAALNLQQQSD